MKKIVIIIISVIIIILVFYLLMSYINKKQDFNSQKGDLVQKAVDLYNQKKQLGVDFSSGPCLGKITDDWVVDIAHQPRQAVDDLVQNQCADFRNGLVHHFIELTPDGKLIKIY